MKHLAANVAAGVFQVTVGRVVVVLIFMFLSFKPGYPKCTKFNYTCVYQGDGGAQAIPYPCKRGLTTKYRPTPHSGLKFLLRSNVYLNMHPCVDALEKCSSNGWFMRTNLQIIDVRLISNLPNSRRTKPG